MACDSLGGVATPTGGCPVVGVGDNPPAARTADIERTGVDESTIIPPRLGVAMRCDTRSRYACSSSFSGIWSIAPSNSATNSIASAWRAAGSAASALSKAACSAAGQATSGRTSASVRGFPIIRAMNASPATLDLKALSPVRTRKAMRARA